MITLKICLFLTVHPNHSINLPHNGTIRTKGLFANLKLITITVNHFQVPAGCCFKYSECAIFSNLALLPAFMPDIFMTPSTLRARQQCCNLGTAGGDEMCEQHNFTRPKMAPPTIFAPERESINMTGRKKPLEMMSSFLGENKSARVFIFMRSARKGR